MLFHCLKMNVKWTFELRQTREIHTTPSNRSLDFRTDGFHDVASKLLGRPSRSRTAGRIAGCNDFALRNERLKQIVDEGDDDTREQKQ